MRSFVFALQFLTRIPVTSPSAPSERDLRWAAAFYPVVGLLIGLAAAAVYIASAARLSWPVSIVLALLFVIVITGALHEDGLADCVDGFGGARDPHRVLEIMRDSRIGTFGALAVIFVVLLKYTLLLSLSEPDRIRCLIGAPLLSRWLVLPLAILTRPARADGLGTAFAQQIRPPQMLLSAIPVVLVGGWLFRAWFAAVVTGAVAATGCFGVYCYRRIGGLTGDCYGAAIQLAEVATLLAMALVAPAS